MSFSKLDDYQKPPTDPEFEGGDDTNDNEKKDGFTRQRADSLGASFIDENFTFFEGILMIMRYSIWPIVAMIFHPTYMLVNAKILGQI